ncbi:glycosyltransferase [Dokdonella sp.]|uniref:glycosyltransferase n=1 Tax=Dokdonella sp. TaxID=2291710 RepID=UPI002F40E80A
MAEGPVPGRTRVLVVSDEMEVGGSQRQIAHLLAGLDRSRWQAELLYFRNRSFLADRLAESGIRVHELPKRGRIDPRFVLRLAALLRRGRYDIVHCFSLTAELWVRALLPLSPRCAYIASVRGLCLHHTRRQWRCKRWIVRRADAVIANALAGAQATALNTGLPLGRISLVPNGVEMPAPLSAQRREVERDALGLPAGRRCGLFVGRLVAVKNIPLLLDALARVAPPRRPFLLLAGGGPLEADLRAQATRLGLDADVRFLGERGDAQALMQCADFLVLCSREEGLSNVVLEAMAVGCAPVASAVGGNTELVEHERNGLLFPSDDAPALAAALERIAGDDALRARLGTAARDDARNGYAVDEMVRRTEAVYARVLRAHRDASGNTGR